MSPLLPRAPSTSTLSSSTATPAPSTTSSTSVNFEGSFTSWDTRVGSPVYSSWGVPASTPATSKSSGGLLSSKPGVAGLCAGIAVVCLLIAGYIYYRVSNRHNNPAQFPVASTPIPPSSTGRSSKVAPSPFRLGTRKVHPLQDDNTSNTSSHSLRQSHLSRVPLTESAAQPGQVVEFPLIKYQHTASSVSAYNSLQRLSAKELSEGSNIPIDDYTGLASRSSERPLSTTESQASNLESSSQAGSQLLLAPTPQSAAAIANRRPLPTPPHPPPSYDVASSTVPGPLSPLRALASHARNLAFPDSDPSGSSHSLSSTPQPSTTPQPFTSVSTVSITQPQAPRIEYAYTINLATGERSQPKPSDNAQAPSTAPANGNTTVEQPRTSLHMGTPASPVFTAENDPFSNSRYELPAWLSSDPFPHQTLKRSASQPSLYGGPARSVAASSRVLPSDSSIRTLTPEPTSPRPRSTSLLPPPSIRPLSATSSSIMALGAVEGQGPAPEDLFIQHGAERQGWTTPLNLTASRSLRRVPDDRFEANESHPIRLSRTLSRTSEMITSPSANTNVNANATAADMAMNVNGSGVRRSTFLDIAPTPLSSAMPATANSGRGLTRAFSIDSPRRSSARVVLGGAPLSRGRSFEVGSPSFPDRPSTNFSAGLSGYEELGWLDMNPGSANNMNGLVRKPSLAASSNILPSEAGSIRSISPELGYIPTGESEEGHAPVRMEALSKREGPSQATNPGSSIQDSQRASKLSIGEGGILWGRLTSVMEAQERSPSDKTPQ